MKDKLYKNHHRGIYYRIKAFFFIFVLFSGAMAIAIIPTYIALSANTSESTHAEQEVVEENEDNDVEEEIDNSLHFE